MAQVQQQWLLRQQHPQTVELLLPWVFQSFAGRHGPVAFSMFAETSLEPGGSVLQSVLGGSVFERFGRSLRSMVL